MSKHVTVIKYERGTNELLDRIYDDEDGPVWIVQAFAGRVPILANTPEEALERYMAKYKGRSYSTLGGIE